jgi:hypothetical protein
METQRNQNEFNMAVSYLNRLNNLFYIADEASMKLNTDLWFHSLITIFRELSTEMKPKEIIEFKTKINNINISVQKQSSQMIRTGRMNTPQELFFKLNDLELDLRKILKESGLQNKIMDDPRFSIK